MDAIKLLGLIEDLDQALQKLSDAQVGQDPLELLGAIEAVDVALLALGADVPKTPEVQPDAPIVDDNPLYSSIINGDVDVTLELLNQVREEAVKDPTHPQLKPAVQKIVDLLKQENTEE